MFQFIKNSSNFGLSKKQTWNIIIRHAFFMPSPFKNGEFLRILTEAMRSWPRRSWTTNRRTWRWDKHDEIRAAMECREHSSISFHIRLINYGIIPLWDNRLIFIYISNINLISIPLKIRLNYRYGIINWALMIWNINDMADINWAFNWKFGFNWKIMFQMEWYGNINGDEKRD